MTQASNHDAMGLASGLQGEARSALGEGDTVLAAQKYAAAGEILKAVSAAARKRRERDHLLFLAASSYYHGGHYKEALKLARRIEARFLSPHEAKLFAQFVKDAATRAEVGYAQSVRNEVQRLRKRREWAAALELLKTHHFVMAREVMACCRGNFCDEMGEYDVAALFHKEALKFAPDNPDVMFLTSVHACSLLLARSVDQIQEYVAVQLAELGHAAAYLNAAWLTNYRLQHEPDQGTRLGLSRTVLEYFQTGRDRFDRLPESFRQYPFFRDLMELAFIVAIVPTLESDGQVAANSLLDAALKAMPSSARLRHLRQLIAAGGNSATTIIEASEYVNEQSRRAAEQFELRSRQSDLAA